MEGFRPRESIQEPEQVSDLIVEVGCGPRALLADAPEEYLKDFKENENKTYTGIDIHQGYIDEARDAFPYSVREQLGDAVGRVEFKHGSGTELPFPDEAVSEIIFRNVFGEPRVSVSDKQTMLQEALRVLKKDGTATVVEDLTPQVFERADLLSYGRNLFQNEPEVMMEAHGRGILSGEPHALIVVFKKERPTER